MTLSQNRAKLSLAIICLNEEANIERCIRSVPFADEVIVLDSGSTDATREIAKSLGAQVFNEPWRGFRDQKRRATDLCRNEWVLSLDADEALSPEAADEIETLLASPKLGSATGFESPRLTWNLGRWIRHGGWYPDRQLRLYDRRQSRWEGGEHVHERVRSRITQQLEHPIQHWPFATLAVQVETNNRYSTLGAQELQRRKKKFSILKLVLKPISKFLETYFVKRGFLDGLPGFIIAVGASYSIFLKFAKLWEAERAESDLTRTENLPE
jgi:glycosyltransferase involved in cell wall biosynthesis